MEEDKEALRLEFLRTVIVGATIAFTLSCAMGLGMLAWQVTPPLDSAQARPCAGGQGIRGFTLADC